MTDRDAELLLRKRLLYAALLDKRSENWTMAECEIGAALAKDEQIQQFLEEHIKNG